jgi:hypothetical protein
MQAGFVAPSTGRVVALIFLAWLSMLGVDFLVHAGLLASLYTQSSPFLLSPTTAFTLIPLGYLSFALLVLLLVWLMIRLQVAGWRAGAIFGLELGGLMWGAFVLGLLSISTAPAPLLVGWLVGQTVELGIAGAVVGSGFGGRRLRWLVGIAVALLVLCVSATILLQSLGVVPTIRLPS